MSDPYRQQVSYIQPETPLETPKSDTFSRDPKVSYIQPETQQKTPKSHTFSQKPRPFSRKRAKAKKAFPHKIDQKAAKP